MYDPEDGAFMKAVDDELGRLSTLEPVGLLRDAHEWLGRFLDGDVDDSDWPDVSGLREEIGYYLEEQENA